MNLEIFKEDIKQYIKHIYDLILEDYKEYLSNEKQSFIKNFNYDEDIVIDDGGKYSNSPGRWESKTRKIHLSPSTFYDFSYKNAINRSIEHIDIKILENKLKDSANEFFTENELLSFIKQQELSCLDVVKGIILHEVMHSIINVKINDEVICVNYNEKIYECRGVKGEYLDEGLVEYNARKFANKHNLLFIPSIPYQKNIDYVKRLERLLGKNIYKLTFNSNYKGFFNYIHEIGLLEEYNDIENKWLTARIINRIKNRNIKEELIDFSEENDL